MDDFKIWRHDAETEALMRMSRCEDCVHCVIPEPNEPRNDGLADYFIRQAAGTAGLTVKQHQLVDQLADQLNWAEALNCWCRDMSEFTGREDKVDGCSSFEPTDAAMAKFRQYQNGGKERRQL